MSNQPSFSEANKLELELVTETEFGVENFNVELTMDYRPVVADYNKLINRPSINRIELVGNKSPHELGLATLQDIPTKISRFENDVPYTTPTTAHKIVDDEIHNRNLTSETEVMDMITDTASQLTPKSSFDALAAKVDAIKVPTKVSELVNDSGYATNTSLDALSRQLNTTNTTVSNLQNQVSGLSSSVTGLSTNVTTLNTNYTNVNNKVTSLQTSMNTLSGNVSTISGKVDTIESKLLNAIYYEEIVKSEYLLGNGVTTYNVYKTTSYASSTTETKDTSTGALRITSPYVASSYFNAPVRVNARSVKVNITDYSKLTAEFTITSGTVGITVALSSAAVSAGSYGNVIYSSSIKTNGKVEIDFDNVPSAFTSFSKTGSYYLCLYVSGNVTINSMYLTKR